MKRIRDFKYSTTFYRRRKQIRVELDTEHDGSSEQGPSESIEIEYNPESPTREIIEEDDDSDGSVQNFECENLEESCSDPESESEDAANITKTGEKDLDAFKIRHFLSVWATKNQIPHNPALNELLAGLSQCGIPNLPKDSRTLLQTPHSVPVTQMGQGDFWYNGINNCLKYISHYVKDCADYTVKLDFGIDGLPLAKSSSHQFWPILLKIANIPKYPCQIVAIYYGKGKPPSVSEYLQQFCTNLKDLIQSGLEVDGIHLRVVINAFICDTPARCFILSVVQFNAYHGCLKCTVVGEYHRKQRRMSYPQTDCPLRTNQEFRDKADPAHHQKYENGEFIFTALETLPMDMIKDVIIADSLHLIDFGVTKKSLQMWVQGSKDINIKFFNNQITEISNWLFNSNKYMPSEINRSVRSLDSLSFWKATEFHSFLFYLGPVILKDYLSTEVYRHFLLFFVAVFLSSSSVFKDKLDLAHKMLVDYVENFISIYGIHSITSNIHNLCHIVDDVKRFGPLPNISSYPFENKLGTIKRLLRSGNKPLHQAVKRLVEIENNLQYNFKPENKFSLKYAVTENFEKPPGINECFKKVILKNGTRFSSDDKDCWLLTKDNKIIKIKSLYLDNGVVTIFGQIIKKKKNFFDYPFSSLSINIYKASLQFCELEKHVSETEIKCKLVGLKYHDQLIFIPLIHTFDLFII